MATICNPILFFVTSPRSPLKMRPEMDLLVSKFGGQRWKRNRRLQAAYANELAKLPDFKGKGSESEPTFTSRDRMTRAPKALGFVDLDNISLTSAGKLFFDDDLQEEILLRQALKFQLPSPFHSVSKKVVKKFCVRPYLEILRLVYTLGRLSFDELSLFGLQLTDWHDFDAIVNTVRVFRKERENHKGRYKQFIHRHKSKIVAEIFANEISAGRIKTREARVVNLQKFIRTKSQTMRDYADACVRYLRATGLITVSNPGRSISIIESRRDEVAYILKTVDRAPAYINDEQAYCRYLFDVDLPRLLTDDKATLEKKAVECHAVESLKEAKATKQVDLKKAIKKAKEVQKQGAINAQITELKAFTKYDEVVTVFNAIKSKDAYDPSLALEWNAWRAMTMMDGGDIRANLTFDDAGNPLSTAPGNNPDIVCDYGDFTVTVEVTLKSGNKQYDAEGEPVARHLGDIKAKTGKDAYCIFVAPTINPAVVAYFYSLHLANIRRYGGKAIIIPMTLSRFVGMLAQSKNCGYVPSPRKVREFCEYSRTSAALASDEEDWYDRISKKADDWLS